MRKLALTLLLGVSLPAFASIQSDIDGGSSAIDALKKATASCESASCQEDAITALLEAGVTIEVALAAALNTFPSSADAIAAVTKAALSTSKDDSTVTLKLIAEAAIKLEVSVENIATGLNDAAPEGTDLAEIVTLLDDTAAGKTVTVVDNQIVIEVIVNDDISDS